MGDYAPHQQQLLDPNEDFAAGIQENSGTNNLREFEQFYRIFTDENARQEEQQISMAMADAPQPTNYEPIWLEKGDENYNILIEEPKEPEAYADVVNAVQPVQEQLCAVYQRHV